jgi:GAF domain-containing protein
MFTLQTTENLSKTELYDELTRQTEALLQGETDAIANAANLSSLLYHALPQVNWVGFYFHRNGELIVGPFQGKPACVHIEIGKGVCGTAAAKRETIVVDNVHEFPGHIACDSASNSEIVVPLAVNDRLVGVLDIDSPEFNRFDAIDRRGLESIVEIFLRYTTVWVE